MSIFKVPMRVLKLWPFGIDRRNFFNGVKGSNRKMAWISWNNVLASKKYGVLGVSRFFALNCALPSNWACRFFFSRFLSMLRFIKAIYGESGALSSSISSSRRSPWLVIIREVAALRSKGITLMSFICKKVCNGLDFLFWEDI